MNDLPGYIGHGGNGSKPSGMICVDGKLYLAVQNIIGNKPPRHRARSQHGDDAIIIMSPEHGKTWLPDVGGIVAELFTAGGAR